MKLRSVRILQTFVWIGATMAAGAAEPEHVPGRLLAGVRDEGAARRVLSLHRANVRRELHGLSAVSIDVPEQAAAATLESLRRSGAFDYVEPDYYAHTANDPNDPSYVSQWHLRRIGGPLAWTLSTGSDAVVVAIIDSGVNANHPDLAAKLVPGWNFVKNDANTSDVLGHGTGVAGILAAATNNAIGVAGVNWASRIMPLVAVDKADFAAYSDVAAAIIYATDRGVRVINASVGGSYPSATLQKAVDYAWSKGALVFAAAMNQGGSTPYYPAACAHAVGVSASDGNDRLASFSNYGSWITLAAPGTGILSTAGTAGYAFWTGTSFASPIAAGVAALVLSVNPGLTNAQVVAILKETADRAGAAPDAYFGWGRVNAYRAVRAATPDRTQTVPEAHEVLRARRMRLH